MIELLAAVTVFLLSHMIPMRPRFCQPLQRRLGRKGIYATINQDIAIKKVGYHQRTAKTGS